MKAGRYSSGASYLSAARVFSRDSGHPEHPLIPHAIRKSVNSIERGVGQQRQTHALPLQRMEDLPECDSPWTRDGPVGPADTLVVSSWWLMREIETSAINMSEVTLDERLLRAELRLSCSKNDCRAIGKGRVHGCCCDVATAVKYCPFHAVLRHRRRVLRMFPEAALDPGFPFFPNEKGERGSKQAFQATVEMAAELLGLPSRGPRGEAYFTGHVCRRTGAEAFTAAGIEIAVTQIFGRWGKAMVLRYCQEAPLACSFQIASRLRRPSRSTMSPELLKATVAHLESRDARNPAGASVGRR